MAHDGGRTTGAFEFAGRQHPSNHVIMGISPYHNNIIVARSNSSESRNEAEWGPLSPRMQAGQSASTKARISRPELLILTKLFLKIEMKACFYHSIPLLFPTNGKIAGRDGSNIIVPALNMCAAWDPFNSEI